MAGIDEFSEMGLFPRTGSLCWGYGVVQGCLLADKLNTYSWGVDRLGLLMQCGV